MQGGQENKDDPMALLDIGEKGEGKKKGKGEGGEKEKKEKGGKKTKELKRKCLRNIHLKSGKSTVSQIHKIGKVK